MFKSDFFQNMINMNIFNYDYFLYFVWYKTDMNR